MTSRRSRLGRVDLGPWTITLRRAHARGCGRGRVLVVAVVVTVLFGSVAAPALADGPSATVQPSVNVLPPGLRFVSVSGSGYFTGCAPGDDVGIGFPNGTCTAGPFVITNGDAASAILVSATDFSRTPVFPGSTNAAFTSVPLQTGDGSGDTANWSLCDVDAGNGFSSGAPQCSGPVPGPPMSNVEHNLPGADEAWLLLDSSVDSLYDQLYLDESATLGPEPVCDVAWGLGNCLAAPDSESTETLQLVGPTATTDDAYALYSTITFMAVPGE